MIKVTTHTRRMRILIRMCICDDNRADVEELRRLVQLYSEEHPQFPITIDVFKSAYDLLDFVSEHGGFDIYLLDIIMPDIDGMELAKRIRERGEPAEILFLTVSREYAVEAFHVKASNYLLKPIQKADFDSEVSDCIYKLEPKDKPSLLLKTKEGMRKIAIRELVMIESFNHSRSCTLADGTIVETAATLVSLYEELCVYPCFYMPHRAYIVHLDYVHGLANSELLLSNGKRLPVSRKVYGDLKTVFLDYMVDKNTNVQNAH